MGSAIPKIAFYSPLGGVQRTTLTLLTGLYLAERYGINTLVADLDIETPGVFAYIDTCKCKRERKEIKEYAKLLDSYMRGRFSGELLESCWSNKLFLFPTAPKPRLASLAEYALSFELGKVDEPIRMRSASIFRRVLEEAARSVKAKIILIDLGPGVEALTRLFLKYVVDGVVLLTRADSISRRRFIEMTKELKRAGDLRLRIDERYEYIRFIFTSVPIEAQREGICLDEQTEKELQRIYREIRRELGIVEEAFDTVKLVPELLSPLCCDPIAEIWENRGQWPYQCVADVADKLAKEMGARV